MNNLCGKSWIGLLQLWVTGGGKTRIYSGPETSAVSDCDEKKNSVPLYTHAECPVAVEEVITTSPIQEFCNDQR